MKNTIIILFLSLLIACSATKQLESQGFPLPGWRSLVSCLLLDDDALPSGWARIRDLPKNSLTDPTINHVYRSWWGEKQGYGKVEQSIWRSYSIVDAQDFFQELLGNSFPKITPSTEPEIIEPDNLYIPFRTPNAINYKDMKADELYIACGWKADPYCIAIARYRNYNVEVSADWETIDPIDGTTSKGLSLEEIEKILEAVDHKMTKKLSTGQYQCDK